MPWAAGMAGLVPLPGTGIRALRGRACCCKCEMILLTAPRLNVADEAELRAFPALGASGGDAQETGTAKISPPSIAALRGERDRAPADKAEPSRDYRPGRADEPHDQGCDDPDTATARHKWRGVQWLLLRTRAGISIRQACCAGSDSYSSYQRACVRRRAGGTPAA